MIAAAAAAALAWGAGGSLSGPASRPGDTAVARWKGGARAAVSITMDDGYASQWRSMPALLASRGFAGTFFVVTEWIEAEGLWPRWREVAEAGHEIGSHGHTHAPFTRLSPAQLAEEMAGSRRRIQEALGPAHGRTLAYPQSSASRSLAQAAARAGYEAARTGGTAFNPATPDDLFRVESLHPVSGTPLHEMNLWVDEIRSRGGWLVVGVHGIADPDRPSSPTQEGWEPIPLERYVAFVDHIAAAGSDLWVAPFGEVARYVRARDAAAAAAAGPVSAREIVVLLRGEEGGPPLTLETAVPDGWAEVRVETAGGGEAVLPARRDGGVRKVLYAAAAPARVRLTPAALAAVP
ncbi:MAG TPA: polysaccharide deacetylase family protein [Candidatus Polarisedimenticolia bacterium]|nr:polysaccharide deacetylase family protein [Candidatus Polarisedimenticolia bacterium]